jgi:predicted transposase/invertase (TIGR01784 family)
MVEMALSKKAKKIEKAYKELQYLSQDKEAREEFDAYQRLKINEKMKIQYAEEKGMKAGREEGKIEGAKEKQIEIAKEMLKLNIPIETIVQVTKLTEEKIKKL